MRRVKRTTTPSRARLLFLALAIMAAFSGTTSAQSESPDAITGRLVVSLYREHAVAVVDAKGGDVRLVPTGVGPRGLLATGDAVIVANRGSGRAPASSLTILDRTTLAPRRTVFACENCAPTALGLDDAGRLYLTAQAHKAVTFLDPPYATPAGSILTDWGWPVEVAQLPGSRLLVVGMRSTNELGLIDLDTRRARRKLIDLGPAHLAPRPGAAEIWIADDQGRIRRFDTASLADDAPVPEPIITADRIVRLVFEPKGRFLFAAGASTKHVLAIDVEKRAIVSKLKLAEPPSALAVSPDGRHMAAALYEGTAIVIASIGEDGTLEASHEVPLGAFAGDMLWID